MWQQRILWGIGPHRVVHCSVCWVWHRLGGWGALHDVPAGPGRREIAVDCESHPFGRKVLGCGHRMFAQKSFCL